MSCNCRKFNTHRHFNLQVAQLQLPRAEARHGAELQAAQAEAAKLRERLREAEAQLASQAGNRFLNFYILAY